MRLLIGFLVAALATPGGVRGQQGWSVDAGLLVAHDLRHDNGPNVGPLGGELRVFAPSAGEWAWGGSLAYHRYGSYTFASVTDFSVDRSTLLAGERGRRRGLLSPAVSGEVGLSLVLGTEDPSDAGPGRDPGFGGYVGLGLRPGTGAAVRPFAELGLHALVVTGEQTDNGGVYLAGAFGLSF